MSSPWKQIPAVQPVDFDEIQSEQYARALQEKENAKFSKHLAQQVLEHQNVVTSKIEDEPGPSSSHCSKDNVHEIALNAIKNEVPYNIDQFCDSDRIIAEMLQAQFDRDHDLELKKIEKNANKDSKVSVSFKNYMTFPEDLIYDSDEDDGDGYYDVPENRKNWDTFDANKKVLDSLPKKGFGYDEDGLMITKHDANLCGIRNACRVMSFPPEFQTGDAVDIKLSNQVFNQLKIYSQKSKHNKAVDRRDNVETAEMGVDEQTKIILYKLIGNQILEHVNGIISTGKEAVILHAESDPAYPGEHTLPKHCAVKIFKTTLNEFKQRDLYIKDDFRFKKRFKTKFSKQNARTIINMWAEKEMYNLCRMRKHGINCPEIVVLKKHVLVMSFIGIENQAAPKLKEAPLSAAELIVAYDEITEMMHKMYNKAKLVHADLSEYNILWHDQKCWIIDVAQSVEPEHPSALQFLMRDCDNISSVKLSFFCFEIPFLLSLGLLFPILVFHSARCTKC